MTSIDYPFVPLDLGGKYGVHAARLAVQTYYSGGAALTIIDAETEERIATVTTRLPALPDEGCVWVQVDSDLLPFLAGLLEPTGRTRTSGWNTYAEMRMLAALAEANEIRRDS
jgi:hypothetical protein